MNTFKLTVIVENTATKNGLLAEHGLAFWIEIGSHKVLFDVGQTGIIQHNAAKLGIDLTAADAIILSHGHYDHTGGLAGILNNKEPKSLFIHSDALEEKYTKDLDGTVRYIGMHSETIARLRQMPNVVKIYEPTEVCDGLFVTGPIPRLTDFEDTGGKFYKDKACLEPDDLIDDQAAFVDTPAGIVVILGCAHSGVINTLYYIKELLPQRPICAVVGGMHLVKSGENRIGKTIEMLKELGVRQIVPLHCTGMAATVRLLTEFPERVEVGPVGTKFEF